jgi:four helix bundle protein
MSIKSFRELEVYQESFRLQQEIFMRSKAWSRDEAYSLTDQARRAVRSIGSNIAEAWGKRRYPAHFLSKLTDADGEIQETLHWLDTARACGYLDLEAHARLIETTEAVGRLLGGVIAKHETFCLR